MACQCCRGTDRDSHVKHLEMFIAVAFGKPGASYNFSEEGVDNLTKAHASMGIEAKHFEIVASHLQGCMEVLPYFCYLFVLVLLSVMVALLFAATITAGLSSLLATNAGSAWDNARKYIETGAHGGATDSDMDTNTNTNTANRSPTYLAAVVGDTLGDPLKGVLAPAVLALIVLLAALTLVFMPLFV